MKIISNKKWEKLKELEETNIKLGCQIMQDDETINDLEAKLKLANKEIEDLKKNIRKDCNCKVELVSGKDTKKEKKEFKKTTKKVKNVVDEIVESKVPKKRGRKPKNAK